MFACQMCGVERETAERLALHCSQVHGPDANLGCIGLGGPSIRSRVNWIKVAFFDATLFCMHFFRLELL